MVLLVVANSSISWRRSALLMRIFFLTELRVSFIVPFILLLFDGVLQYLLEDVGNVNRDLYASLKLLHLHTLLIAFLHFLGNEKGRT